MRNSRQSSTHTVVKQSQYVELRPRGRRWHVALMVGGHAVTSRTVRTKALAWLAAELLCQRGR